jgi:polyribonucleotide nucleotidyltransferase
MFLKQGINLGGRELTMETGRIAKQADGAVLVSQGETVVLVTAVSARQAKEGASFFPLTVDTATPPDASPAAISNAKGARPRERF